MKTCSIPLITKEIQVKTTPEDGYYQKFEKGIEKRQPLYTVGGNVNYCGHYRLTVYFSKKNLNYQMTL
jgi:hypothetical protein